MGSDAVEVVTTTSCISTRSERFEKEQLRVNRKRLQVMRERIRHNNSHNNTTTSVVAGGNSNSNNGNKNKPHRLQVGGQNKSASIVKYSRIVCLLTFVLLVCGLFLLLSPIIFLLPSSSQSSTQTISSASVHDISNTLFVPPIIRNNKNDEDNWVVSATNRGSDSNNKAAAASASAFYHVPPNDNTHNVKQSLSWQKLNKKSIYQKSRTQKPPQQIPTHLPLPIFVLNMPKSGSTTIHQYFVCGMGKLYSIHYAYNKRGMDPLEVDRIHPDMNLAATCMGHNFLMDKPLIQGCGGFPVWTDSGGVVWDIKGDENRVLDSEYDDYGATTTDNNQNQRPIAITKKENDKKKHHGWCFYPGVHALENIANYYPYATILHLPRNSTDWVRSSTGWSNTMEALGTNSSSNYEDAINDRKNRNVNNGSPKSHTTTTKKEDKVQTLAQIKARMIRDHGNTILDRYEIKCHGFEQNELIGPTINENKTKTSQKIHIVRKTDKEWMEWYDTKYTQRIRDFAMNHPTLTYFESKLDDPQTPTRLEKATGISASCFGHSLKTADRLVQWKEKNAKDQNTNQKNTDTPPKRAKARKK